MTNRKVAPDPLDLDGQAKAKAEQEEAERVRRLVEIDDLKWVMKHPQGRRLMWRLLEKFGVFRSSFDSDALVMAFREGQRNDGLQLLLDIHEHTPEHYMKLLGEQKRD